MKRIITVFSLIVMLFGSALVSAAALDPMLKKYKGFSYGDSDTYLSGYIPALDATVVRPWELVRWTGVFNFSGNKSTKINNYDVFNVKRKADDPNFDKENGFGLVYRSQKALGDLFDAIMIDQTMGAKQRSYFRDTFIKSADDPIFTNGNPFYYEVQDSSFLRTSGIVQRMGIKFTETKKISSDDRQAIYEVSKWPEMKAAANSGKLRIDYSAYGVSQRDIRIVATKKGAFPDFSKVVSLTGGKLINTSEEAHKGSLQVDYKELAATLGKEIDVVMDDGYGRTVIQTVKLPEANVDYKPFKLSLTEGGQLWVKFRHTGPDIPKAGYVSDRGMPMIAKAKVGGATTAEFSLQSMFKDLPATIKDGQEFNYMLGKIEIGDAPGKYYIKVDATINNPDHQDRALESPAEAYTNNMIHGDWMIEHKGPETDLIAQSVTVSPSTIQKGGKANISAKVKNVGTQDQSNVLIRFYDNSTKIYEVRKSMPMNKSITVGPFSWTGNTAGVHNISVHVDPERERLDKDRTNNVATTGCSVIAGGSGENGAGCNNSTVNGNWKVTYPLITGYHTKTRTVTWTDSAGKTHTSTETYTDYSDPIWETREVQYQEQLKINAEVNTKQGIATPPGRQKLADRESRGSWDIIPYAKQNGKNPNEITRAGYGFELKVTTQYSTDWETKVPKGLEGTAKPIGGKYYGPDEVYASIYDSKWNFEKKIKLEKTGGDRNAATWELPMVTDSTESGKEYSERKYYTSINAPDGEYRVVISTSAAGMNALTACITKKVEIWGSMYDDVQNLRVE